MQPQGGTFLLLVISVIPLTYAGIVPVQVVPQGIESVNGSNASMGCTSPLVKFNNSDMMVCGSPCDSTTSYLLDGNSPAIDTSIPGWASQLVTVRKNDATLELQDHVVLTFGFDTAVSLTKIELDLFLCPEWNIGAPFISVYANKSSSLVFDPPSVAVINHTPSKTSCDSLTNITISFQGLTTFPTWHIVVTFASQPDTEWFYVGEVRFPGVKKMDLNYNSGSSCPPQTTIFSDTTVPTSMDLTTCPCPTTTSTSLVSTHITSTPGQTPTSVPPKPTIPTDNTKTIVAATCVPLIVFFLLVATAVIVGIYFTRKRYPNCKEYFHGHSDTELGKWQNVVGESGAEFVCAEQEDDYRNHKENNHVSTAIEVTEPHKCEDYLANPLYNTSNAAQQEYMTECLYDQVTKEDLGQDADDIDFSDYTDAQSMPTPSSGGGNAPAYEEKRVKEELGQFKPVYSDVSKSSPAVPQKSNDLLKYLATRVPATNAPPPPPAKKKSPTAHPALSRISDNPVYQGTEAALSLQNRMDSSTGEEMYNQPVVHLTTPHNSSEPNIHRGFTVKEELAPQPSAPPLYPESHAGDGIYSEPIKPSDFAFDREHEKEEVEGQPHVYAPVYAVPAMLPEGFQQPVEITNDNIVEKKELGVGQFGKVVLAATNGLSLTDMQISKTDDNRDISILVAVKKLMPHPSQAEREMFEKEVKFMSCLKHQNVVRLIGVCYNDPAFIMMEYMEEGDLSQFLQRYSEIVSIITCANNTSQITTSTLVFIASQIASAMKYLAAHNYIHRDLATRNCLVGGNFTIKLADFGMSRNLYESHYYRIQGNAILPIRWMATECFFGIFSEKTDVWAFGVTMWELFTLAKEDPYSSLTDTEVVDDAIKGVYRQLLSRPAVCPKSLYKIMKQCWVIDPKQRASFQDVEEMLQTFWYMPNATL